MRTAAVVSPRHENALQAVVTERKKEEEGAEKKSKESEEWMVKERSTNRQPTMKTSLFRLARSWFRRQINEGPRSFSFMGKSGTAFVTTFYAPGSDPVH